jgi:branched-chain amino acid transport system permease protein
MKNNLLKKTWFRYILNTVSILFLFIVIMMLINSGALNMYYALLLIPIGFNIILAVSLNIAAGFLGQLPLGHAGFMAVGAYASALFSLAVNLPSALEFTLALLIGGFVAACFGVIIGLPALRLRGDYLAIITLGFGEIIRVIILNVKFTGGAYGLRGIEKHTSVAGVFIAVVITLFVLTCIIKSRHGRAILAIREDEIAAEASGIPTTYYKVMAFTVSAFFAGVAGGLYAHYLSILDASTFGFMKSVEILVMVVLGGLGSMIGSVISAIALTLLPEMLRGFSEYRMVIYSLLLVIVMIFKPSGLFGKYDFSFGNSLDKIFTGIRKAVLRKKNKKNTKGGEDNGSGT